MAVRFYNTGLIKAVVFLFSAHFLLTASNVRAQAGQQLPSAADTSGHSVPQGFLLLPSGNVSNDEAARRAIQGLAHGSLTVDRAVQLALLNNMELQARLAEMDIACGDLVQAGLLKNPVFEFLYSKSDASDTVAGLEYSVVMDFMDILYLPMRRKIAQAKYEQTRLEVTHDILKLMFDVHVRYYELVAATETVAMLNGIVEADKASYVAAKKIHEAGNISDLDLHRRQAEYDESKLMLAEAETNQISAREDMNLTLGLWGVTASSWEVSEELPSLPKKEFSGEGMENLAVYQRLDLAAAREEIDVTARELGMNRAMAWLPELELGFNAEREVEGDWLRGGQISLPIPLFDHGQGRNLKNRGRMMRACYKYYAVAVKIRQEVRKARASMFSARQRVRYLDTITLPLKKRIVEESLLMFNAMEISVFELLEAKHDQRTAKLERISALKDYWVARSDLERSMGGSLMPRRPAQSEAVAAQ